MHAASLVDSSWHSSELLELLDVELSAPVIHYLVEYISDIVDDALDRSSVVPSHRPPSYISDFFVFAAKVLYRAETTLSTLLVALAYLDRVSDVVCVASEEWALERLFLGAVICASKYANDSSLRNVHWAMCTQGLFGTRDIGLMEGEFLKVLRWRLGISEADVMAHRERIMAVVGHGAVKTGLTAGNLNTPPGLASRPQHRHRHTCSVSSIDSTSSS
ncbi:hypothetical protein FB45DRAFT_810777, partial [Roridomyces roridus]